MPGESFDSLKDLPRVPHAEGSVHSAIQVGVGGNPPDRRYVTYGDAVDNSVAVARLNARRKGEIPVIPGGLDDHDPRLFAKPKALAPMAKMKVAQSKPLTEADVNRIKSESETSGTPDEVSVVLPDRVETPSREIRGSEGTIPAQVQSSSSPSPTILPPSSGFSPPPMTDVSASCQPPKVVYVEKPVEKIVEKVVEKETEVSKWLKHRVRVEIGLSETSFHVSAVAVVRSIHAVTIMLPTTNDAMTFVPKIGARTKIKYGSSDVVDTIFTGASFEIPELGVLGLAFLVPNGDGD